MARTHPKRKCSANRTDGARCSKWAMAHQEVCSWHGGLAPQARTAAAERAAEAAARKALAPYMADCEAVPDPLTALLKMAGEILAFKTYVGGRVAQLDADQWRYDTAVAEQVRGEIQLYERALDRAAHVLGLICRLNLDERLVRLNERQGSLITEVFEKLLDGLGLPPAEHRRALRLLPPILREVAKDGA